MAKGSVTNYTVLVFLLFIVQCSVPCFKNKVARKP